MTEAPSKPQTTLNVARMSLSSPAATPYLTKEAEMDFDIEDEIIRDFMPPKRGNIKTLVDEVETEILRDLTTITKGE